MSEARGLAGEGCGLAKPRRVVWSSQARGDEAARRIVLGFKMGQMKIYST
jgi:hypothetical protein